MMKTEVEKDGSDVTDSFPRAEKGQCNYTIPVFPPLNPTI